MRGKAAGQGGDGNALRYRGWGVWGVGVGAGVGVERAASVERGVGGGGGAMGVRAGVGGGGGAGAINRRDEEWDQEPWVHERGLGQGGEYAEREGRMDGGVCGWWG